MTGEPASFPEVVDTAKRLVLEKLFAGELKVLGQKAQELLGLPEAEVTAAIAELLVAFKVYRTYRRREPLGRTDRAVLDRAFGAAEERLTGGAATALARLRSLFEEEPDEARQGWLNGFQQLSGPVMAKSLEDTAFYRFPRLLALNEVGGEPDAHGVTPEKLHALNLERLEQWPHTMLPPPPTIPSAARTPGPGWPCSPRCRRSGRPPSAAGARRTRRSGPKGCIQRTSTRSTRRSSEPGRWTSGRPTRAASRPSTSGARATSSRRCARARSGAAGWIRIRPTRRPPWASPGPFSIPNAPAIS